MVSQDSPPHPDTTNILHQFITTQNQFDQSQHFDAYGSNSFRATSNHDNTNTNDITLITHSLGVLPSLESLGERMSRTIDLVQSQNQNQPPPVSEESTQISHTRRLMDLLGATTNDSNQQAQQRLSLSLNSHNILVPPMQQHQQQYHRQRPLSSDLMPNPNYLISAESDEYPFTASSSASLNHHRHCANLYGGAESLVGIIAGSRYLKPTQSLLEELVNVGGKEINLSNEKYVGKLFRGGRTRGALSLSSELRAEFCSSGIISSSSEKQEVQVKLAKLISLLEEVENRYEKYYHQMEEVMTTFEVIAGQGTAKSYTALALQAMSRHFCSLRDAIVSRINAERRKLLQDLPKISAGLSQLSLLDRDQPRNSCNNSSCSNNNNNRICLQQLGLIQSHQRQAWRPIRGLPETSVAILRAWLFEHFLHPYPNDSEKLMLASQTGLSKNQVSNWFINARVRLWKPMIEEMYKEEFGESSDDSNPLAGNALAGEGATDHEED